MARIAVVGDSHVWEKGMKSLLEEADFEVLPASEQEAFADCAIVEVSDIGTFKLVNAVVESYPNLPVVGVVEEIDVASVSLTLSAGARTAILDSSSPSEIRSAIEAAVNGLTLLPTAVARSLAHHVPAAEYLTEWISDAEVTWLRQMASGMTVGDLSAEIGYSERAMFRHLKALYFRLGVRNRTEALLWAKQRGLLG